MKHLDSGLEYFMLKIDFWYLCITHSKILFEVLFLFLYHCTWQLQSL